MKCGLFYELSVPRPWTRESERTVYENALEQVRLASTPSISSRCGWWRARVHPRSNVLGAVGSTDAAVTALRERWGFPASRGEIGLSRYHDRRAGPVS
jgi:hypothetical protein